MSQQSPKVANGVIFWFCFIMNRFLYIHVSVIVLIILKNYLFIYLFMATLVFVAARRLSPVAPSGATLCCGARASYCSSFSCCGAQAVGAQALEPRLSSCGTRA